MYQVPDIIVIDFCEWLNKKIENREIKKNRIFDVIFDISDDRWLLVDYAQEYLHDRYSDFECPLEYMMILFFRSKEFRQDLRKCHYHRCKDYGFHCSDKEYCICEDRLHYALDCFFRKNRKFINNECFSEVSADALASYTRWVFLNDYNNDVKQMPPMEHLIINSSLELSEELDFFDWMEKKTKYATEIYKMPSKMFEMYVDKYVEECQKPGTTKKRLLKAYQKTGLKKLFEKLQILLRIRGRESKSLNEAIERYCSGYGRYKCIILPLEDERNQRIYTDLITQSWESLNSCSGNYLDIYYSEKDTGKSGFEIANQIKMLPNRLKNTAPSIIIWKDSMENAEAVPIRELDNTQIVELIRCIVESIRSKKKFNDIIKEAQNKVTELKEERKGIVNYYAPVITGDGNVVGNNNTVGTGNISGNANTVTGNVVNPEIPIKQIVDDFDTAIRAIQKSQELNEDMKKQLLDIFEKAKSGVTEQSQEKQEDAKTAFKYVKSFLTKVAPSFVATLADIATIVTFFGLVL